MSVIEKPVTLGTTNFLLKDITELPSESVS